MWRFFRVRGWDGNKHKISTSKLLLEVLFSTFSVTEPSSAHDMLLSEGPGIVFLLQFFFSFPFYFVVKKIQIQECLDLNNIQIVKYLNFRNIHI
jgi:hypothetical protein